MSTTHYTRAWLDELIGEGWGIGEFDDPEEDLIRMLKDMGLELEEGNDG